MSTEERLPAEERSGNSGAPGHEEVISNRPDDADVGPGPHRAEDDDEETEENEEDEEDIDK